MSYVHIDVRAPAAQQENFNSAMTEEEFFKWLKSKGVSEKDCKTLSGSYIMHNVVLMSSCN